VIQCERLMKKACAQAIVAAVAVFSLPVAAQADDGGHAKAVDLFSQARKRIAAGDCAGAIPKLVASVQLEPSVGAELSLADCYEKTDPLQAWRQVEEAARVAEEKHDVRLGSVTERAAALAAKLPTVQIVVPPASDVPELEVRIDGVKVDSFLYLRGPIATTAGANLVDAAALPKKWSQSVDAQIGHPVSVTVDLQAEKTPSVGPVPAPAAPAPPPVAPATSSGRRTFGFVAAGVGVGGLAVGIVTGLIASSDASGIKKACGAGGLSSCGAAQGSQDTAVSSAKGVATISTVGFIAGGALFALGAVLVLTAPSGPSTASASLVLTPILGPGEGGAAIVGRW